MATAGATLVLAVATFSSVRSANRTARAAEQSLLAGLWPILAASRHGDFDALVAALDPEVVVRADREAVRMGASGEVRGATAVAETFAGRAQVTRPALVDGEVGAVWASGGRPRVVFGFTISRGKIVEIDLVADPERLRQLDLTVLDD